MKELLNKLMIRLSFASIALALMIVVLEQFHTLKGQLPGVKKASW